MRRLGPPLVLILLALVVGSAPSNGAVQSHPLIKRALGALQSAQKDLQNAAHDYCGHRVSALDATNAAIDQLQLALDCAARKDSAIDVQPELEPESSGANDEHHPNIDRAIGALESAEGDLQNAAHGFCGHRVAALDAVHVALAQLKLATQCDSK